MPVFIGSIPNSTKEDLQLARGIVAGEVNTSGSRKQLAEKLKDILSVEKPFLFNRGRDAMHFLFENMNLKESDEIILQGFTCVAAVSPILWNRCKPVFVDIERNTFNIDFRKLKESITDKTKVIVIQHTFGNLVNMQEVRRMVDDINQRRDVDSKIFVLEDCAHIFDTRNKEIGRYSDAFFFSFAQDKSISSTQGSMLVVNNTAFFNENLEKQYDLVEELSSREAIYNATYIIYWSRIKQLYFTLEIPFLKFSIGKALLLLYRFFGLIRKQASVETTVFTGIHKLSDIQSKLLLQQLGLSEKFNQHREGIRKIYEENLNSNLKIISRDSTLLRYPLLVQNPDEVRKALREIKVLAGRWYSTPVFPILWESLETVGYKVGLLSEVEYACRHVINLPLNIEVDEKSARVIVDIVNRVAIPL